MADDQEQVSGNFRAPTWAMGAILAALLGGGAILGVTGSTARPASPAVPLSHDSTLMEAQKAAQAEVQAQAAATAGALSRIEGKIDRQAAEIATVRESVAEIRGELKAKAPRR